MIIIEDSKWRTPAAPPPPMIRRVPEVESQAHGALSKRSRVVRQARADGAVRFTMIYIYILYTIYHIPCTMFHTVYV